MMLQSVREYLLDVPANANLLTVIRSPFESLLVDPPAYGNESPQLTGTTRIFGARIQSDCGRAMVSIQILTTRFQLKSVPSISSRDKSPQLTGTTRIVRARIQSDYGRAMIGIQILTTRFQLKSVPSIPSRDKPYHFLKRWSDSLLSGSAARHFAQGFLGVPSLCGI